MHGNAAEAAESPFATPRTGRPSVKPTVTFATNLLQRLLPEDHARRCDDHDLEGPAAAAGNLVSYKSFAPGPRRFQLCVKRNPLAMAEFRLLDRRGPFGQSKGRWSISNVATRSRVHAGVTSLFRADWYHAFLDARLRVQLLAICAAYLMCFCIFAVAFLLAEERCGLQIDGSFTSAYMLSVETVMTIGYGVADPYMHRCWEGPIILTSASLIQMVLGAGLMGVVFQRISRPQARARTILFSEKAAIRCIDGAYHLMFRICDLRIQYALIEPRVRCFCAHVHPERGYELAPMRLQQPDDELGAPMLLTLPYLVVHRLDSWSPLVPRSHLTRSASTASEFSAYSHATMESDAGDRQLRAPSWPTPAQRQVDSEVGGRSSCACPTCGETFSTTVLLERHCRYLAQADERSGIPREFSHRVLDEAELQLVGHVDPTRKEIKEHLERNYCEVVVLVEGTEPTTASTLQARHSYVVGGASKLDVGWDSKFVECCRVRTDGTKGLALDLGRFHELEKLARPFKEDEE